MYSEVEYEKVIGFAQVVEDGDIAVHRHRDVHLSCHYVGGRRRGGSRERHRDVRVGDCMVCMGGGGDIVGADCQEFQKDGEGERVQIADYLRMRIDAGRRIRAGGRQCVGDCAVCAHARRILCARQVGRI